MCGTLHLAGHGKKITTWIMRNEVQYTSDLVLLAVLDCLKNSLASLSDSKTAKLRESHITCLAWHPTTTSPGAAGVGAGGSGVGSFGASTSRAMPTANRALED